MQADAQVEKAGGVGREGCEVCDGDRTLIARFELRTRCITDIELLALAKTFGVTLDALIIDQQTKLETRVRHAF